MTTNSLSQSRTALRSAGIECRQTSVSLSGTSKCRTFVSMIYGTRMSSTRQKIYPEKQKSQTTNGFDSLGFLFLCIHLMRNPDFENDSQYLAFLTVTLLVFYCRELPDNVC